MKLHIDIETYSSEPIKTSGGYRYLESFDMEILLVAYAFDNKEIKIVDMAQGEELPQEFLSALVDPKVEKWAHNAPFERHAFRNYGYDIPIEQWFCSMVKSAYCGLPLPLAEVSKALELGEYGKKSTGGVLIRYFCQPCKPTKKNKQRTRNYPHHDLEKWEEFKNYCIGDVVAEREICKELSKYTIPDQERELYILDQQINDRGILIDLDFAQKAWDTYSEYILTLLVRMKEITGLDNPNSLPQLKKWLGDVMQREITQLTKDTIPTLLTETEDETVSEVLSIRQKLGKSSSTKYLAMLNCVASDGRAHGLIQFYGALRTGRWAGRLAQVHNLPQNHLEDIEADRDTVKTGSFDFISFMYGNVPVVLSELIRTAFVAKPGYTFAVADFSSIEARVIAWLANEQWRLDVFNTHGKIYEASASMMFGVPMEQVTKGSDYRAKGKVAELALGYQGSVGALTQMGGEDMGLTPGEMKGIVKKWRKANPGIVRLWEEVNAAAIVALKGRREVPFKNLIFGYDGTALTIQLPSGRKLFYWKPRFEINRYHKLSIQYHGINSDTHQWDFISTYGGKLVENIVQAIARDLLAEAMIRTDEQDIVIHVHDEIIREVPKEFFQKAKLNEMIEIMSEPVKWSTGLPLGADGYITPFYKKD